MSQKILLRSVNWVGDAIMTLPAIRALRQARPETHIAILAKPWVAPLYEHNPNIDEIIPLGDEYQGLVGARRLARRLRSRGFTEALLLQNAFGAALTAYLARIPNRVGYARDLRGPLLTNAVPCAPETLRLHHIEYYLNLMGALGMNTSPRPEPWLYLGIEERLAARQRLQALPRPIIGLNPGAAYGSAKQWPPERFAQVASQVMERHGAGIVIFGGPGEAAIAEDIAARIRPRGGPVMNAAASTTLRELAALISECDVLVSNDSGPMHVGYAVRTPLVAIFGSTDPGLTGPPPEGSVTLVADTDCSPCFERKCPDGSMRCMQSITVDAVLEGIEGLLPKRKAVFFDRDGTLCVDAHFLNDWKDHREFEDIGVLAELRARGYMLIGVSNQSGIGRGIVDERFVREVNAYYVARHGFDAFYYCPHAPDEGCECRKPSPWMLLRAREEFGIDPRASFVVGDRDADMLMGRAAGARGILVRTGKQQESQYADHTVDGLTGLLEIIG